MAAFLRGFAACYVFAFFSYYLQFPGLFGPHGLAPATKIHGPFSGYQKQINEYGITTAAFLEACSLLGLLCGMLGTLGFDHIIIFALNYVLYLTLYLSSPEFLSFQWDIFLLETGFVALLFCKTFGQVKSSIPAHWVVRSLFVKFLLNTGYTKLTSGCQTWKDLTAAEYHMASQCLPTAEAWWFHQFPPILSRLSIAIMFIIQVPILIFLLLPIRQFRIVGVALNAFLQFMIILSGNYNWFNIHTLVLLLPCAASDGDFKSKDSKKWKPQLAQLNLMLYIAAISVVVGIYLRMYKLEYTECSLEGAPYWLPPSLWQDCWRLKTLYSSEDLTTFVDTYLRYGPTAQFMTMIYYILKQVWGEPKMFRKFCTIIYGMVCLLVLGIGFLSWDQVVHRGAQFTGKSSIKEIYHPLGKWHLTNSYGLFRRMTGVGKSFKKPWGGLQMPNVEVPAVILEGHDGKGWKEITFRYAPGPEDKSPVRTAPHQPRLDWQMWFAALGSYQHNAWLMHLIFKLLRGAPHHDPVVALLHDAYPFQGKPPQAIRASLYHYDFTRLDTPWNPKDDQVAVNSPRWWSRKQAREYLPPLSLDDEQFQNLVRAHGWDKKPISRCKLGQHLDTVRSFVPQGNGFAVGSFFVDMPCFLLSIAALGVFF